MEKHQKFLYSEGIDQYLDKHQVFELFEDLLKQIVMEKPDRPLDYLLKKIKGNQVRRVFLMGAPAIDQSEVLSALGSEFGWKQISVGKVLKDHVASKGPHAAAIDACLKARTFGKCSITIWLTLHVNS